MLGISKLARLHLVEVTFTTDFALVARVAAMSRQHQQLCQLLHDAGWHDVVLHIFVVGHTGVMGNDNTGILEALIRWPSWAADSLVTCSMHSGTAGQRLWSNQMRPPPISIGLLCRHLVGWSQPLGGVVVPEGKF